VIGRELEVGLVEGLLAGAAEGRPFVLTVRGERGSGRSSVLGAARELAGAAGFRVLAARGIHGAPGPAHSGLSSLLRPLSAELDGLAADARDAVTAAVTLSGDELRPIDVHVGVLQLLTQAAEATPLLLLLDDVDHLDAESVDVLAFAIGRLGVDRIGVAAATGLGPGPLDAVTTDVLPLSPLSTDALGEIVRSQVSCADAVAATIAAWADGSPLLALELARSLTPEELSGTAPMPASPRPTVLVVDRLQRELAELPIAAQHALVVAALDRSGSVVVVTKALAALGEPAAALDAAEAAGFVEIDGDALRFRHALARPLAERLVAAPSRRAAHRALAAALTEPRQVAERVWHLVASATGRDEDLAQTLDLVATSERRRGAPASAARALVQAARFATGPGVTTRLTTACLDLIDALDLDGAVELGRDAAGGDDRDAALALVEAVERRDGPEAALALAPDDPAVRADLLRAAGRDREAADALATAGGNDPLADALAAALDVSRPLPGEPDGDAPRERRARRCWLAAAADRGHAPDAPGTVDELLAAAVASARNDRPADALAYVERAAALVPAGCDRLLAEVEDLRRAVAGRAPTDRLAEALSAAELRVAEAVASGLTNRQAAEQLFLSAKTVDFHLQTIYRKLAIRSRAELATRVATRMGTT
jgi:DNA-binding CsgD family transcriptional regulator